MSLSEFSLIGCRISIISKAKIRYEGYLHSVDFDTPNEPVITLSKVWSFGTEDRPCERFVAPRNEEYNQVVFRGRDLEDVRLVKSSVFLNEDSAIVSAAPGTSVSNQTKSQPKDTGSDLQTMDRPSADSAHNCFAQPLTMDSFSQSINRAVGSAVGPSSTQQAQPSTQPPGSKYHGPRPFGDGRSEADGVTSNNARKLDANHLLSPYDNTGNLLSQRNRQQADEQSYNRFGDSRADNTYYKASQSFYSNNCAPNSQENWVNRRTGLDNKWHNNRPMRTPQFGYRRRGSRPNSRYPGSQTSDGIPSLTSDTTNFSEEYDYEKANAELAAVLEKIHISTKSTSSNDGDIAKDDESAASVTGEEYACYDKTRSFFDTLSSEMMDKANGVTSHGMNRRDERVLNTTTFGAAPPPTFYRRGAGGRSGGAHNQRRFGGGRGHWRSTGFNNNNSTHRTAPFHYGPGNTDTLGTFSPMADSGVAR